MKWGERLKISAIIERLRRAVSKTANAGIRCPSCGVYELNQFGNCDNCGYRFGSSDYENNEESWLALKTKAQ
jgi:DNA-directed RNA polymerase subunit RPC12/RpoP